MKRKRLFAFILSLATVLLLIDFTPLKGNSESKTTENIVETAEAVLKTPAEELFSSSASVTEENTEVYEAADKQGIVGDANVCDAAEEALSAANEDSSVKIAKTSKDEKERFLMEEFVEFDNGVAPIRRVKEKKTEEVSIITLLEDTGVCTIEYAGTEISVSERDFKILCRIVEAEASIEDTLGKQLVANVVLNRVVSNRFPNTIEGVVFDGDAFTSTYNGRYSSVDVEQSTIDAVLDVLNGADESMGAVYFLNKKTARSKYVKMFDNEMIHLFKHGHHDFYKEDD